MMKFPSIVCALALAIAGVRVNAQTSPYPVKPIGEHGEYRVIPLKELSRFFRIGPNAANSLLLPDNDSDPPRNYVYTRVRLNEGV